MATEKFNVFGGKYSATKSVTEARSSKGLFSGSFCWSLAALYIMNEKTARKMSAIRIGKNFVVDFRGWLICRGGGP